jgi:hypothetical protein
VRRWRRRSPLRKQREEFQARATAAEKAGETAQLEASKTRAELASVTLLYGEAKKEMQALARVLSGRTKPKKPSQRKRAAADIQARKGQLAARSADVEQLHARHEADRRA